MYLQIIFWIIIGYIISTIVGRILFYSAAILHNWCMMALVDAQYWYDSGTTINDIYEEISEGDNFKCGNEIKYGPLANILFPLTWLFAELLLLIIVILVSFIRLTIFIIGLLYEIIWVMCLSKLLRPVFKYLSKVDWPNTWIVKFIKTIITILYNIKKFILNLRIA